MTKAIKERSEFESGFFNDVIEWDVINWSKALAFWDAQVDLDGKNFRCLELGGRRGGLSLWLASKGNDVICSDLENPEMQASALHKKHNVDTRVRYQPVDAMNIPYENSFDIIVFKSILGGISRNGKDHLNQLVIDQIYKALKPGGKLLFAENLKASWLHRSFRAIFVRWGGSWNYVNMKDIDNLLSRFGDVKYATAGFLGAFGRTSGQRNFLGTLDSVIFDRILPRKMSYIVFGVAEKK